jgi:chromosome partitioning protein
MEIWTIANQKGGVGKTTSTVTFGGLLAEWNLRTLLVDIDPQASLSGYLGYYDYEKLAGRSVYDLFMAMGQGHHIDVQRLILKTQTPQLHLIAGVPALATLEKKSGQETLKGLGLALKRAVSQIENDYDYLLIDCPPGIGILLINALAACDRLLIPVQTEFLAIKGLEQMLRTLSMVMRVRTEPLSYTIFPTYYDPRTKASVQSLAQLRRSYPEHIWDGYIPVDTKLRDASQAGIPPSSYDPRSRAVMAYANLLTVLRQQQPQGADSASSATGHPHS